MIYLHLGGRHRLCSPSPCGGEPRIRRVSDSRYFADTILIALTFCDNTGAGAEHSQSSGLLLREDPDEEVGLVVGLKGGGDQQVVPRRQREALRHLPHVDVGLAASLGRMVAEEIFPCLVLIFWSLNGWRNKRS